MHNRESEGSNTSSSCELQAWELEEIAVLYDSIRGVRRRVEVGIDKSLAEDFDRHLKAVMTTLSHNLNRKSTVGGGNINN